MTSRTLVFALATLAACAAGGAAAEYSAPTRSTRAQVEPYAGQPVESVARRPLMNSERWEVLGDYSMLVWEGRAKAWLVDFAHDDEQWAKHELPLVREWQSRWDVSKRGVEVGSLDVPTTNAGGRTQATHGSFDNNIDALTTTLERIRGSRLVAPMEWLDFD